MCPKIPLQHLGTPVTPIRFSQGNRRNDQFILRYGTGPAGFVTRPKATPATNEALSSEVGRYANHGKEFTYRFTPEAGREYKLECRVVNGYDAHNRDAHFHLHPSTYYSSISITLDLTKYGEYPEATYPHPREPNLFFHDTDPFDHDVCKLRGLGRPIPAAESKPWMWTWKLDDKDEGVIDLSWSLIDPASPLPHIGKNQRADTKLSVRSLKCEIKRKLAISSLLLKMKHESESPSGRVLGQRLRKDKDKSVRLSNSGVRMYLNRIDAEFPFREMKSRGLSCTWSRDATEQIKKAMDHYTKQWQMWQTFE